jgi:hypothetical protein
MTGRKNYFSEQVGGYNIIILDSNYMSGGKSIDADHDDTFIYTGTLPDNQEDWLKDQLKSHDKNLIFVHHPLYNLTNSSDIEDIVKKYKKNVILIANGHKHPSSMRTSTFGGVKNYDIPSVQFSKAYSFIRINGENAQVLSRSIR